jgi:hypothetical protein
MKNIKNFNDFVNEQRDFSLRNDVCKIIDDFTIKYGKTLAAHPSIKRVENDVLGILAENIDKFLNYGNYRKIWTIIDNFTKNDALFDDNNMGLAETILEQLY